MIVDNDVRIMGVNVEWMLEEYDVGDHQVQLVDVAANCSLAGPATVGASLVAGDTVDVLFAVSCTALPAATQNVTGTWIGQATKMSTKPVDAVAVVTYVLEQLGDSVAVTFVEWRENLTLVSTFGVGRVSGDTFTLFEHTTTSGGTVFRNTHTLTVNGTQMVGTTTERLGQYADSLALTKQ